ncbi:MAG: hypothetical protein CXT70_02925 [Methanobacteriota archaeon]|nr:MAG: hypothetical protein CXT70_02925 [Euryarchaeota archaeon]
MISDTNGAECNSKAKWIPREMKFGANALKPSEGYGSSCDQWDDQETTTLPDSTPCHRGSGLLSNAMKKAVR